MRITLATSGEFDALIVEGWRIPCAQVRPLFDATSALSNVNDRISRFEAERQAALAAAREQGFQAGLADGRARALADSAEDARTLFDRLRVFQDEMRSAVGSLALDVVRHLAGELGEGPLLERIAETTVLALLDEHPFAVRVPPEQARRMTAWSAQAPVALRIVSDPTLETDECVVETGKGAVRAGLRLQLMALEHAFARAGEQAEVR